MADGCFYTEDVDSIQKIFTQEPVYRPPFCCHANYLTFGLVKASVADPDPPDPRVSGPPGSGSGSISQRYRSGSGSNPGSGSFYHQAKKEKNLDFYCFVTSF
jgi:hypothetical protein